MKKLLIFLLTNTLIVIQLISPVSANDFALSSKTWLQELPPNQVLYAQPFLNSVAYKKLTPQQQEKYKINYFMSKKLSVLNKKLTYSVTFALSIPFLLFGAHALGLNTPKQTMKNFADNMGFGELLTSFSGNNAPSASAQPGLKDIIISTGIIFSPIITSLYIGWGKLAWQAFSNRFLSRIEDPVEKYEIEYIKKKEFLSLGTSLEVEKQFSISRTDPTRLSNVINFVEIALKMPDNNARIDFKKEKIDIIFEGYDSTLKDQVKAFTLRQVLMQEISKKPVQPFREGKRIAAYFQGLPGSGKTRFAELTAQAIDLPFARISLEGSSISDLVGRNVNTGDPTPGLIVQALANAQVNGKTAKNTVLFIDEADRVINDSKSEILPFLLKLLDPESKTFFNPYLNTDVDISNLTIILAGNYDIQDEALRKRLQIINFKGFTPEFKKQIIWKNTLQKMCNSYSKNGKYQLSSNDFTSEDISRINQLIDLDQDPGFRTIESILMDYLDYKFMVKYFDKDTPLPKLIEKIELSNLEQQKKTTAVKH